MIIILKKKKKTKLEKQNIYIDLLCRELVAIHGSDKFYGRQAQEPIVCAIHT